MRLHYFILFASLVFLIVTCKTQKELVPTQIRQVKPEQVAGYHEPINITIAWYPYQNQILERQDDGTWKVIKSDSARSGKVPVILIRYPNSTDSIWLDMNTKNETLGKLLKHSLMTQEPITRPFGEYLETAKCTKCHPSDVEVDFER